MRETYADGAVGRQRGDRQGVTGGAAFFGHTGALDIIGQVGAATFDGTGKARIGRQGKRRAIAVTDIGVGTEGECFRRQGVAGQISDLVTQGDFVIGVIGQAALRAQHHGGTVQVPAHVICGRAIDADTDGAFQRGRIQGFTEIQNHRVAAFHLAKTIPRHPGLQRRWFTVDLRRWRITLIGIRLQTERQHAPGLFQTQHFRLDHTDGVDHQHAVFHDGGAGQFQVQQVLAQCAIGFRIFCRHRHIHEQLHMARGIFRLRVAVRQQETAGIGDEAHTDFAGLKPRRHLAGDVHCYRGTTQQRSTRHTQRRHVRKVRHERQLCMHIALLLRAGFIPQQQRIHRHAVDRGAGQWRKNGAVLRICGALHQNFTRRRILRRPAQAGFGERLIEHVAQPCTGGELIGFTRCQVCCRVQRQVMSFYQDRRRHKRAVAIGQRHRVAVTHTRTRQWLAELHTEAGEIHHRQYIAIGNNAVDHKAVAVIRCHRHRVTSATDSRPGTEMDALRRYAGLACAGVQRAKHDAIGRRRIERVQRRQHQAASVVHGVGGECHGLIRRVQNLYGITRRGVGQCVRETQRHRRAGGHFLLRVIGKAVFQPGMVPVVCAGALCAAATTGADQQCCREQRGAAYAVLCHNRLLDARHQNFSVMEPLNTWTSPSAVTVSYGLVVTFGSLETRSKSRSRRWWYW